MILIIFTPRDRDNADDKAHLKSPSPTRLLRIERVLDE